MMNELIRAALVISKAIKPKTRIHHIHSEDVVKTKINFSKIHSGVDIVCFTFKTPENGSNNKTIVCKVDDLKNWIRNNRDKVYIHNHEITLAREDMISWDFAKQREFSINFGEYEEPKPVERLQGNGMRMRSVEVEKGVFRDLWYNAEEDKYYDLKNWEFTYEVKRGKNKGMNYKAVEPYEFVEVEIV